MPQVQTHSYQDGDLAPELDVKTSPNLSNLQFLQQISHVDQQTMKRLPVTGILTNKDAGHVMI